MKIRWKTFLDPLRLGKNVPESRRKCRRNGNDFIWQWLSHGLKGTVALQENSAT
jgi:hypothetical protein